MKKLIHTPGVTSQEITDQLIEQIKNQDRRAIATTLRGIRSYNEEPDVINPFTVDWRNSSFNLSFQDGRHLKITPEDMIRTRWLNKIWDIATTRTQKRSFSTSRFDFLA